MYKSLKEKAKLNLVTNEAVIEGFLEEITMIVSLCTLL